MGWPKSRVGRARRGSPYQPWAHAHHRADPLFFALFRGHYLRSIVEVFFCALLRLFSPIFAMQLWQILILAVVQGACELLPVSSSAHVIIAEKLMGIDPTTPEMTLLLVALHTGTMFAVLAYFWRAWCAELFGSTTSFWNFVKQLVTATAATGVIGLVLLFLIEKVALRGHDNAEV